LPKIGTAVAVLCAIALVAFAILPLAGCQNDVPPPYSSGFVTVTFDPNFGNWSGDFRNKTFKIVRYTTVFVPAAPVREFSGFNGWYTERTGGELYSFSRLVSDPITLYARWSPMFYFTSAESITAYLAGQTVNDKDSPLFLPVIINLGNMTAAGSGWRDLLTAINNGGKFVALDLSLCPMSGGTTFNPVFGISTGRIKLRP